MRPRDGAPGAGKPATGLAGLTPAEKARHHRAARIGDSMVWLCGGALALNLLLVLGLLVLLAVNGLGYFWPSEIVRLELNDGQKLLGEVHEVEAIPPRAGEAAGAPRTRLLLKVGNRDLTGQDFLWIDASAIRSRAVPPDAVVFERLEYGNFYGTIAEVKDHGKVVSQGPQAWEEFLRDHPAELDARARVLDFERHQLAPANHEIERLRLEKRRVEISGMSPERKAAELADIERRTQETTAQSQQLTDRLFAIRDEQLRKTVVLEAADGRRKEIPMGSIVRATRANELGLLGALRVYFARAWEFVADDPRESNTEGGIFPAIFGTVLMVFLMSFAVAPLGVLAALYLREYAKQGLLVRIVRIAVNNLAGVPSIVFGVFGLGFFVYVIGGTIDQLFFPEALPNPTFGTGGILWAALTLAILTVPVVIVATEEGLAAVPRIVREGSFAMGATKFETTWRVVIPAAAPGILTGLILAMARAAGEVAPLMIVGMVKLAPAMPIDGNFPFLHFERKFMHLGFHIYDVGFQSPNVDATKPLVFATAFLLILIVTVMNLVAISLRNRLRRKYAGSAV
jgi:phosphate transport system permease protein